MVQKVLDLRFAERDQDGKLVGQGGRAETIQTHLGDETLHMFVVALSPLQHKIYALMLKATRPVTRGEIAKRLQYKKTNWFNAGVEGLVERGYLRRTESRLANGMTVFHYEVVR